MIRMLGPGLIGIVLLALWLYCIFDVIATDESLVRNLPKFVWLILVIFVPTIGSIAWLALGRPLYAGWTPGGTTSRPPPPPRYVAPEDRADWTDSRRAEREAELRRREAELQRREDELRGRDPDPT